MTRRLLLVFTFLLGAVLTTSGIVAAQETDIDIAAVSEVVLAADPDAVAAGLETPPDDADLPEGFLNPPSGIPENADVIEDFTGGIGDVEGTIGNVSHAFDTDTSVVPGSMSSGVISYLVDDEEITPDDFSEFEDDLRQEFEIATPDSENDIDDATPSSAPQRSVDRIDLGGLEAVVITVVTEEAGISAVVHLVAVPVGHTLVIGTALVADQGTVDPDDVLPFAEALTLAGVAYLATVAEDAQ